MTCFFFFYLLNQFPCIFICVCAIFTTSCSFWVNIACGIAIGYWASTYSYNAIAMKLTTISEINHGYTALSDRYIVPLLPSELALWLGWDRGVGAGGQPPLHFSRRGAGIALPHFVHKLSYPVLVYFKSFIQNYNSESKLVLLQLDCINTRIGDYQ